MKSKLLNLTAILTVSMALPAFAQINISDGNYSQNFDSLSMTGTANPWTENATLPGWYAAKNLPLPTGAVVAAYRASAGAENNGALYSYGPTNVAERALGSVGSGTPGSHIYGVRIKNDTADGKTLKISYAGEQWRDGGNASAATQPLVFSYRIDNGEITSPDPNTNSSWTVFPALTFITPSVGTTAKSLDGNNATNRTVFSNISLPDVLLPNQEIFLRWIDVNDAGNDHGVAIDDLSIVFETADTTPVAPEITAQPQNQTVVQGNTATFSVTATGTSPLVYTWYFGNDEIPGATTATLTVPFANTNNAGNYYVNISNTAGNTNSATVSLTVTVPTVIKTNIAYLRTLMDATYAPANTTNLYEIEGTVSTYFNMTTIEHAQFYIHDGTAGIAVFVSGGAQRPAAGDVVKVVGPLGQFNGLFELNLVNANPTHSVTTIGTAPMPGPVQFHFASTNDVPLMESTIEGSVVVVSNVYLQGAGNMFTLSGGNFNMTNLLGQVFVMRMDARITDMVAQTIPEFASSITGVMGQFDNSVPYSGGYQLMIRRLADLVPGTPLPFSVPLQVKRNGSDVVVSWISSDSGFALQASSSLTTPDWQTAPQTPVVDGNTNTVTISSPSGNNFYRLYKP
jgi:hypothetical protein